MMELVTFGETMVVCTPPGKNEKIRTSNELIKGIAGAESNVAIGLARLGHSVAWIGKVGDDPFGEEIMYRLKGEGVNTSYVKVDPFHATGLFFKERRRGNQFSIYYYRKESAGSFLSSDEISENLIRNSKILHITGITPALSNRCEGALKHSLALAKKHGVKISFDPNIRLKLWSIEKAREYLLPLIKEVDYFFPGVEEARLLLNENLSHDEIIDKFLYLGAKQVILKLGPEGCISANRHKRIISKGIEVTEVDPVGAGDGFCAGYLSGVLKGWEHEECARLANIMGAFAVTEIGDYEGLPSYKEVEQFLRKEEFISR